MSLGLAHSHREVGVLQFEPLQPEKEKDVYEKKILRDEEWFIRQTFNRLETWNKKSNTRQIDKINPKNDLQ